MSHHLRCISKRLALAGCVAALLGAVPARSAVTDISNTPLASAANMSVLPNVMFILDDSGSMHFDGMPDNIENNQGGSERRFFHEDYQCKPRGITTSSSTSALNGLPTNFCDRVDPPFGATEFNGLYYNPQVTYRPAVNSDGTTFPNIKQATQSSFASPKNTWSWTNAPCDPYPTNENCVDAYPIGNFSDYYNNSAALSQTAKTNSGTNYTQSVSYSSIQSSGTGNGVIAQWYGSGNTLDLTAKFPEIVYCNSTAASATDGTGTQCRRNGLTASIGVTNGFDTNSPFRYTSAHWRTGYPEAPPINQFVRTSSGSTVTVTTPDAHGLYSGSSAVTIAASGHYPAFSTYQIIPRTSTGSSGAGFDTCSSVNPATNCITAITITPTATNQFTYSKNSGAAVAYSQFDLIVNMLRQKKSAADTTVYVTAPNHGLINGDKINVYALAPNNTFTAGTGQHIGCSQGATQTVTYIDANHFTYVVTGCTWTGTADATVAGFFQKTGLFNIPKLRQSNAFYYSIQPVEYCSDAGLTTCVASTTPTGGFTYAAPVRFCANPFDANRIDTPSGIDPITNQARCRKKYFETAPFDATKDPPGPRAGYVYPRYGQFLRQDILSTTTTYTGRDTRTDCAAKPTCTYAEEMTNFANWFSYYRYRMLMMKTSAGLSFIPIDSRYKVGFITINPGNPVDSAQFLPVKKFDATQKSAWYTMFYSQAPGGGTPLQEALSRVGRYYAGIGNTGINKTMIDPANGKPDPIEYSCQQNFAILTTDGYWNGALGQDLKGNTIGDVDNTAQRPYFDGNVDTKTPWDPDGAGTDYSSKSTLADVALYYYQTDLRSSGSIGALGADVSLDNVPTTANDSANWQHMVTFSLGMSTGLMDWQPDYDSPGSKGDYGNVRDGALSGCSWVNGQCNWPVPGGPSSGPANLDDLWHAAVNGRGKFFYARDTQAVQNGLNGALTSLQARNASGAAAATSSPNITSTDHAIYETTYTTVQWNGEMIAQLIDPNTGLLMPGVTWSAKSQLQSQIGPASDTRTIYTFDNTVTGKIKAFLPYDGNAANTNQLSSTEMAMFTNLCATASWSQCATLDYGSGTVSAPSTGSNLWIANQAANVVNFLRGQTQYEATVFRDRQYALGDTVSSAPVYVAKPSQAYTDMVTPTYQTWAAQGSIIGRTPTVYVGANDGMLHAFNANTGVEQWAYIPKIVQQNLFKLADMNYATQHVYFVDGSITATDAFDGSTWRTLLVSGLNSGGRGYFALDVTDPLNPKALWEFCSSSTLCPVSDANMGYSYGNPVITKRPDGKWVVIVTSGYNNVSPGDGVGHFYILDAFTGAILQQYATTAGDSTTPNPSGLGKINVWADNYRIDNTGKYVYGGDMLGNIWKLDLTASSPSAFLLAQALDTSGKGQPITTKPEMTLVQDVNRVLYFGTGRYVGNSDLTDPATQTPAGTSAWQQSLYAFKDTGVALGNLRLASGMVKQIITTLSTTTRSVSASPVNWATQTGWFVDFNPGGASPGERVNVDPQLVLGTLVVSTNVPTTSACVSGGDSWTYQFDYQTGSFIASSPSGLVASKLTGTLTVGTVLYQLQSGSIGAFMNPSSGQPPIHTDVRTGQGSNPHRRTSWRELTK